MVRAVAVITGRPARQALALGDLDEVGNAIGRPGRELFVFGQYGNERWSLHQPPGASRPGRRAGWRRFERELPRLLRSAGAADAYVEEKGLAVAVHTRRLDDPAGAFERLLADAAPSWPSATTSSSSPAATSSRCARAACTRVRPCGRSSTEQEASGVVFGGDDLGDVEAFEAVRALRAEGLPGSAGVLGLDEQPDLVELADVVVDGPAGRRRSSCSRLAATRR